MLIGRRTSDVGDRMAADEPGSSDYPASGPMFLLTHRPPDPPDPRFTILSGDIGEAVATALAAAGGKNLEILGADVAAQALRRGLVDEILVYVLPIVLGDGIRFRPRAARGWTWTRSAASSRAPSRSFGSESASNPSSPVCFEGAEPVEAFEGIRDRAPSTSLSIAAQTVEKLSGCSL